MTNTKTPPADFAMGPRAGRCTHQEVLPGLESNAWRCGRDFCHSGAHAFAPEFDETLGPIIEKARNAKEAA